MSTELEQQKKESLKLLNFEALAGFQTNSLIQNLHFIGELADKDTYSYTSQHAEQIIETIENEIMILKEKFKNGGDRRGKGFTFRV